MKPGRLVFHLGAAIWIWACSWTNCLGGDYFQDLTALINAVERGFITNTSVVDPETKCPITKDEPIPMLTLRRGELCGVRLGMTMEEVVERWGKPNALFSFCIIGPRMSYGVSFPPSPDPSNIIWLFFQSNRLEVLAVSVRSVSDLRFDNGLTGTVGQEELIRMMGTPLYNPPKVPVCEGTLVYVDQNIRMDLRFYQQSALALRAGLSPEHSCAIIAVRFANGVTLDGKGEPDGPANRSQPIQLGTNSTPLPAGSGR